MELIFNRAVPVKLYHGFCVAFYFTEKLEEDIVGQSYYKVAVKGDKYMGSTWELGSNSNSTDLKWARCLFYSLDMFLREYFSFYGLLPTSGENQGLEFVDGLKYFCRGKMHQPGIRFDVVGANELSWENAKMEFKELSVSTLVPYGAN